MKLMFIGWVWKRMQEPSMWMGVAMIAVVLGSDPVQALGVVEAVSLIVGGGLVMTGASRRRLMLLAEKRKKAGAATGDTVKDGDENKEAR